MKREWKKLCKCFDSIPKPWQNIKQQKKIKRTHQVKKSNSWVASPGFSQESHYITCGLQCQNSENPQQIKIDRQYLPKHFKPNNKYCQNVFKSNWFFSAFLSLSRSGRSIWFVFSEIRKMLHSIWLCNWTWVVLGNFFSRTLFRCCSPWKLHHLSYNRTIHNIQI